jgi:hypothetical protein
MFNSKLFDMTFVMSGHNVRAQNRVFSMFSFPSKSPTRRDCYEFNSAATSDSGMYTKVSYLLQALLWRCQAGAAANTWGQADLHWLIQAARCQCRHSFMGGTSAPRIWQHLVMNVHLNLAADRQAQSPPSVHCCGYLHEQAQGLHQLAAM